MIQLANRHLSDRLTVTALTADGRSAKESIWLHAAGHADEHLERHSAPGTDAHAVKPGAEHGIVGSQPGPNKNERHG
jgi:Icc protein